MQRRSFFGVVFGGFLARWLPQKQTVTYAEMQRAYEAAASPGTPVTGIRDEYFMAEWYEYGRREDGTFGFIRTH